MKIIVDAFGGDNAPLEILKGCAEAVNELDIDILLTGSEAEIRRVANENNISLNRMEIADTPDVITMEDHAGDILKEKSNSSMALGLKLLAEGKGDGFREIRNKKRPAFSCKVSVVDPNFNSIILQTAPCLPCQREVAPQRRRDSCLLPIAFL